MSLIPTTLYIQGGPGLNTAVERAWFGDQLPIQWWEQPRFAADTPAAFESTVDAAIGQLGQLARKRNGAINIVAWSFGARLAVEVAHRAPENIASITLLAPTLCLEKSFLRLAKLLSAHGLGGEALQSAINSIHVADRHEHFVKLVIALLSIPNLFRNYWAPNAEASCTRHLTEAAKTDWFDFATFAAISRDIFDRPLITKELTEIRSIRIVAGRHDPYFEPDVDLSVWRALFPGALVDIVDAGHMIPFERPATEWLMV